jgi:pilus assembly protein CpaF
MLLAMNSGAGAMTSVHANSAREALRKLTTLPLLAGDNIDRHFIARTVVACVDLVVFCSRANGVRQISEIIAVADQVSDGEEPSAGTVFTGGGRSLRWTGERPRRAGRFAECGLDLDGVLR